MPGHAGNSRQIGKARILPVLALFLCVKHHKSENRWVLLCFAMPDDSCKGGQRALRRACKAPNNV
jgi:hypothetical protein